VIQSEEDPEDEAELPRIVHRLDMPLDLAIRWYFFLCITSCKLWSKSLHHQMQTLTPLALESGEIVRGFCETPRCRTAAPRWLLCCRRWHSGLQELCKYYPLDCTTGATTGFYAFFILC
jgi:hypothetical protein